MNPLPPLLAAPRQLARDARVSTTAFVFLVGSLLLQAKSTATDAPDAAAPDVADAVPADLSIAIVPDSPADIGVRNPQRPFTLTQAATFAWQQFITLNWPAVPQTGQPNTRGVIDRSRRFGDQSVPLVWHTFRSKVEVFTSNPPGTTYNPSTQLLQFDFDALPQYPYQVAVVPGQKPAPASTAWINLDETTQIALNQLFAGSTPQPYPGPTNNSEPQQFRYLAKVNRVYFDYVTANGFFNHGTNPVNGIAFNQYLNNYQNAIAQNQQPSAANPVITLPIGTIMVKSAWRLLGPNDVRSRFHTTTVRFYEKNPAGQLVYFQEQNWGMVALHIVIKTQSAPAFIFATFEQADNLRLPNGTSVEDADGNIVVPPPQFPTTPQYVHTDSPNSTTTTVNGPFFIPSSSDQRLFVRELAPSLPKPTRGTGGIAINRRFENIPPVIIAVNRAAHQAISSYSGPTGSPWLYYKLVNVQAQPLKPADRAKQPATYFQANSVVETDFTLGQFSGILIQTGAQNGQTSNYSGGQSAFNVHLPARRGTGYDAYNSGGCMGCHGNAQVAGTDFSFTLSEGPVLAPDVPVADAYNLPRYIGRYGTPAAANR